MFFIVKLNYNNKEYQISAIKAENESGAIEQAKNRLAREIADRSNNEQNLLKEISNIINSSSVIGIREQFKSQEVTDNEI